MYDNNPTRFNMFYIYKMLNTKTGNFYIGRTAILFHRKRGHFFALKEQRHTSEKMMRDYNKYGWASFKFSILKRTKFYNKSFWIEEELIKKMKPNYNIQHNR